MGHDVTLNYIVKANIPEVTWNLSPGKAFKVSKTGTRHYMVGCPLYLADSKWKIIGVCVVEQQSTANGFTALECRLLFLLSEAESGIITRINRMGQEELSKLRQ
jgi:hypothetical protein